jgi:hypothetical protein
MVSARQMNFKYADLYNSLDINGGLSSSLYFRDVGDGDLTLALALSYLYRGAMQPLEITEASFYPGQEFTTAFVADYVFIAFERRFDLVADAIYTLYTEDSYAGGETYDRGAAFQWAFSLTSSVTPKLPLSLRIANYLRSPSDSPVGSTGKSADLFISASATPPFSNTFSPELTLTFGSYAGGGLNRYGDATIIALNAKTEKPITEKATLSYSLGLEGGSFESNAYMGVDGALSLKFNF